MTITKEQLDELERRVSSFAETDLSLVPIECTRAARLVAIARAALAWNETRTAHVAALDEFDECETAAAREACRTTCVALDRARNELAAILGTP